MIVLVQGVSAVTSQFGQFWKARDLQPPSLVVGDVKVKSVELVKSHQIEEPFHFVGRTEVSGHVKMESPVGKPRVIPDLDFPEIDQGSGRLPGRDRDPGPKSLDPIEDTRAGGPRDQDAGISRND